MEINVVDIGDPGLGRVVLNLKTLNQDVIEMQPGPDGVSRMVNQVIQKAGSTGSIDILRIYAHGNAGIINVAGGKYDESDTLSAISITNLDKIETTLSLLKPYFKRGSRVELLGCDVALAANKTISKNSAGERLLTNLARIWSVNVLASGNPKELPLGAIKFVGLVVIATPGGGLACTVPPEISKLSH